MKKLILIGLAFFSIALISSYFLIPAKIKFSTVIIIKTKANIANRFLMSECKWKEWFPSIAVGSLTDSSDKNIYHYKNHFYSLEKKMMNTAEISISNDQLSLKSLISIISINQDSIALEWKSETPEKSNPLIKLKNYIQAKKLHNDMGYILKKLKSFLAKTENIYGVNFHVIISKDSTLVATKSVSSRYPSTSDIFKMVTELKKYISSEGAKENNFPMLHVKTLIDSTFETMVAIPINKKLSGNREIFFKRFVPWKVLTAEVTGGDYKVDKALKEMENYLTDYHIPAMAIPFASLVTDRSQQPDTLKWITRIYTPIP